MAPRLRALSGVYQMAAVFALVACSREDVPLPPAPANVRLTMSEYRMGHEPAQVPNGRVVVDVTNIGRVSHQLTIFRIPDAVSGTLEDQLRSTRRLPASPLAVLPTLEPTKHSTIALDLPSGRYGFVCFLKDGAGTSHAVRGLNGELYVR